MIARPYKLYDVVVVGGGLSGLLVARHLNGISSKDNSNKNICWRLFEARPTLGGRLENDAGGNKVDMGGAWIWPRQQPRISKLVASLGINTFTQPDDLSSTRIQGGAVELVKRIATELPSEKIKTSSPVVACRLVAAQRTNNNDNPSLQSIISLKLESGEEVRTRHVVFAAPPKLLSKHIEFNPPLSHAKVRAMEQSQTWMAGVTKVALIYKSPRFWPLSISNAVFRPASKNQPAFQVYDGSPKGDSSLSALTFFTVASLSNAAEDDDATLARHCVEQFAQHLSSSNSREHVPDIVIEKFKAYDASHVKRWPKENFISEDEYPRGINPHPEPNSFLAQSEWNGQLLFAGTETDLHSPGVMEGAVGAAIRVIDELRHIY